MWIILDYLVVNNHLGVPDVFDARPEELEVSYDISQGEQANVLGRLNIPINCHTQYSWQGPYMQF